jgi:hypothetical protein
MYACAESPGKGVEQRSHSDRISNMSASSPKIMRLTGPSPRLVRDDPPWRQADGARAA